MPLSNERKRKVLQALTNYYRQAAIEDYCSACHDLDPSGPVLPRDIGMSHQYGLGRTFIQRAHEEFRKAAEEGCPKCRILVKAGDHFATMWLNRNKQKVVQGEDAEPTWEGMLIWLEPALNPRCRLLGKARASFEIYPDGDLTEASPYPSSGFLKECFAECRSQHVLCSSTGTTSYPTRLLEIGNRTQIRLIETEQGQQDYPYACLSHCWGDGLPLKTTRDTFQEHAAGIRWSDLSRTFQDAISVCWWVGIEYLWVDSLCIRQDSREDWEVESGKMAKIYEDAILVISATSSSSHKQSFLTKQRHSHTSIALGEIPGGHPGRSMSGRILTTNGIHNDYEAQYGIRDPLDTRTWTFQERLLATRLINFSSDELQWACRTHTRCESGHRELTPFRVLDTLLATLDSTAEAFTHWHDLVKEVSKRLLTQPNDKLPAIAGVAQKIQERTGSDYIAGLWKDNFVQDLCWERHLWQTVPWTSTKSWRAPSFSWASVEGNVFYRSGVDAYKGTTYLTELIDAHCTPVTNRSPFGEVKDGYATLYGPVIKGTSSVHPSAGPHFLWTDEYKAGNWVVPFCRDVKHDVDKVYFKTKEEQRNNPHTTRDSPRDEESIRTSVSDAWALIIAYWDNPSDGNTMLITCIILQESKRDLGAFERVAFVNTHWPPDSSSNVRDYPDIVPVLFGDEGRRELTLV